MSPNYCFNTGVTRLRQSWFWITVLILIVPYGFVPDAFAQFVTGSNGSDGAYNPTVSGNFVPSSFKGTGVANNVFNFTTITFSAGVTVTFSAWYDNAPVYWLATGKVDIETTLNLAGQNGAPSTTDPADVRIPVATGSGGYSGGVGGLGSQPATSGNGPGGGAYGVECG